MVTSYVTHGDMHLEEFLKYYRKRGGTINGFAKELGWDKQKLWRVRRGQDITREDALAIYAGTNRKVTPNDIYLPG